MEVKSTADFDLSSLDDKTLLSLEKLLQIKETRLRFGIDHHKNTRGERLDFRNYPHIVDLYQSIAKDIVLQGSVQSFKSEWLIVDHLAAAYNGLQLFYVLPKYEMRTTYVQNRINRCVENVPEYKKIIGAGFFDSVALKQFGRGTIKYVGSNVLADFTEFPADQLVVEEVDQCNSENVGYALDRLRASPYQFRRYLGNPRNKEVGINLLFIDSTQREWNVPCVACGKYSEASWFDVVVSEVTNREGDIISYKLRDTEWETGCGRDIYLICPKCNGRLDRISKDGKWIAKQKHSIEGYHISMICNLLNRIGDMWDRFQKAINNPILLQQFYNSDLGLPYNASGNRVTPFVLSNSAGDYEFRIDPTGTFGHIPEGYCDEPCSMGVDVGSTLDVRISKLTNRGKRQAVYIGKVKHIDELHELIDKYSVEKAVMDYMPETTLALEFQETAQCDVWLCSYRTEGKDRRRTYNINDRQINIDRTEALDRSFSQIKRKQSILPSNFNLLLAGDFVKEMCGPVREIVTDTSGNTKYAWTACTDHQRHCDTYDMLASELMMDAVIDDCAVG